MTKYRIEIDAIIAVIAETPEDALKQANAIAERSDNVIVTGAEMVPTVLTLEDESDIESIEGELHQPEVEALERGENPAL